jgi:hypothetical protein
MAEGRPVFLIYEDELSGAVLHRLVHEFRPQLRIDLSRNTYGNSQLLGGVHKYVAASQNGIPHIILTDLDRTVCAPELLRKWEVPKLEGLMLFRIAVREIESWLLADRKGIADLFKVPLGKIAAQPDELADPKSELLSIVRRCRSGRLKQDILPASGSSASIGPFYNDILGAFVRRDWNVENAMAYSPSLRKAVQRIGSF